MSTWTRRNFDGIGLTQSPPGPHLPALQARYGGTVLLCIDVSWSMKGKRLKQAVEGGVTFLEEAARERYRSGLILWAWNVHRYLGPDLPHGEVVDGLRAAEVAGGTNLVPALKKCREVMSTITGDRVVCIFSDGEIPNVEKAERIARELCAMGVRIVVRGLGPQAADTLARLRCPGADDDEQQVIVHEADIRAGIASMAGGLAKGRKTKGRD